MPVAEKHPVAHGGDGEHRVEGVDDSMMLEPGCVSTNDDLCEHVQVLLLVLRHLRPGRVAVLLGLKFMMMPQPVDLPVGESRLVDEALSLNVDQRIVPIYIVLALSGGLIQLIGDA